MFDYLVSSIIENLNAKVYNTSRLEIATTLIHFCLSLYPLVFTVIIIYRMISDDDSGRRSMLYLHNVSTGVYASSIFIFSLGLMIAVSIICMVVLFGSNTIPKNFIGSVIFCYIVSAISCAVFSIFIAMLIHKKYSSITPLMYRMLAVIISIVINIIGFFLYSAPIVLSFIPGYYTSMFMNAVLDPTYLSQDRITGGTWMSLASSALFALISVIIFYLRYNVSERVERVRLLGYDYE